jgi:hypothetical protein
MRGDFSRDSFQPAAGFSRVLSQQGRIGLDAETNEAQSIQLHLLRTLAADLVGPYAAVGSGFNITGSNTLHWDFLIQPGRYYVDGWPCQNAVAVAWQGDDDHPRQPWTAEPAQPPQLEAGTYLAYLEVWERHLSAVEHDGMLARAVPGALREVALGGVDTASRAQLIWQVRHARFPAGTPTPTGPLTDVQWNEWAFRLRAGRGIATSSPLMVVKAAEPGIGDPDPCVVSPRAAYRGQENHLYRVEICRGDSGALRGGPPATFVWSRDNGSTVLAVESIAGADVRLATGWRDAASAIGVGDHVEISSPALRLDPGPGPIRRVVGYDPDSLTLTLNSAAGVDASRVADGVVVRRWDHVAAKPETGVPPIANDNALTLLEGRWLTLEDGISIYFGDDRPQPPAGPGLPPIVRLPAHYRRGDYWLFEARADLGDVICPRSDADPPKPLPMPPHGVERHLAPLAAVTFAVDGAPTIVDLRRKIVPVHQP